MVATNQKLLSSPENAIKRTQPTVDTADLMAANVSTQALRSDGASDRRSTPLENEFLGRAVDLERSLLQLPSDFLKTPTTTYQPKYCALTLPDGLVASLQRQAQQDGTDPRSLVLAAFNALLYRYTQQETIDLELTIPADADNSTCTAEVCTQIHGELSVRALISQISTALHDVQGDSAAPQPDQLSKSCSSLPIAITFVEEFFRVEGKKQLLSEFQPQASGVSGSHDLHLIMLQQKGSLSGVLQYNASLFQAETIKRLSGHFQMLLQGIVNDRNRAIGQLPLLTQAETQQLLVDWQSAAVAYPQTPIHRFIEAHAVQQPGAIALRFKDQELTYAALNQRANQLAHYLMHIGVGADVRVAVCVEPSLDIAVCLLGIFKVGGVYLPLDPTHPAERVATILEEAQPKILLTQSHLVSRLPAIEGHVLCLDQEQAVLDPFPTHNPDIEVRLEQTSHLVYTSGTTGKPKGVMTSHGNLVNYIRTAQERFRFDCHDVMPAIARFTFSITMFELLSPLVAGGTLVVLEREHILDFKRMVQTLQQSTIIHTSPSLLQKLLAYIQENNVDLQTFQGLKHVSTGGDMVPVALLETMRRVFQKAEIYVIYGCSEVSCMGCSYPVVSDRPIKSRVGKPFTNVAIRLYDSNQKLVPIGIPGEIYIGGAGVTQGYLQRDELTQEKFVTIDGCRFYRTGDLGRFDADGNLEMLGRADFQIKLRGIRIELGEIEATLRQAPGVREGIVMARELGALGQNEKSLVAYVVLDPAQNPPIENIRSLLQEKLPDYMVPAAFIVLDAMPVNINQKVDRRALPMPTPENIAGFKAFVAPRDEWEQQLTAIWEAALGIQPIGVQNNFFELGGDSLKAVQILTQIDQQWDKALPITALLQAPTIEDLAKLLRSGEAGESGSDLVMLRRGGTKPPLFCLYGVLLYRELVEHLDADRPVYGVYLQEEVELLKTGTLDSQADLLSVPGIAARYLQAIRTLQPHGPYYLAGESFGGVVAFEMAKQLQAAGEAIALVAMFDSLAPYTEIQKPLAQKLKLHWQLLSQQGFSYALEKVRPPMQALRTKLYTLYQRLTPANTALQVLDDTTNGDIRSEMRQQASDSYSPTPYDGKLMLFRAAERDPFEACDRDMGWTTLAAGGLEIFDVPGDHLGILKAPNVRVMAEQLQSQLEASC